MSFLLVMKAEIVRSFIIMRRYWFRTITGMVIGYGMLMVLIAGFIYSRPGVEENLNKFDDPTAARNSRSVFTGCSITSRPLAASKTPRSRSKASQCPESAPADFA